VTHECSLPLVELDPLDYEPIARSHRAEVTQINHLEPLVRVRSVTPLDDFRVRACFEDGTEKELDLEPYLHGPIFESVRSDPALFRSARAEGGTIAWPNGADIDPDVLYYGLRPAWTEVDSEVAEAASR